MLKGYLKCNDIGKMLLEYIEFELSKGDMARVATHLRNCPLCMEKYSKIQRRKKEIKTRFFEIEKRLRMENEVSAYFDKEAGESVVFIVEGMLLTDENYRRELIQTEEISRLLLKAKKSLLKIPDCGVKRALRKKNFFSLLFG